MCPEFQDVTEGSHRKDIQNHLTKGWSVKTVISSATIIMEKPIDMQKVLAGIEKVIEDVKKINAFRID